MSRRASSSVSLAAAWPDIPTTCSPAAPVFADTTSHAPHPAVLAPFTVPLPSPASAPNSCPPNAWVQPNTPQLASNNVPRRASHEGDLPGVCYKQAPTHSDWAPSLSQHFPLTSPHPQPFAQNTLHDWPLTEADFHHLPAALMRPLPTDNNMYPQAAPLMSPAPQPHLYYARGPQAVPQESESSNPSPPSPAFPQAMSVNKSEFVCHGGRLSASGSSSDGDDIASYRSQPRAPFSHAAAHRFAPYEAHAKKALAVPAPPRPHTCREPTRAEFATDEEFRSAWGIWRQLRDCNNESVRRSRSSRKGHGCRNAQCSQLGSKLAAALQLKDLVLKAATAPHTLSRAELAAYQRVLAIRGQAIFGDMQGHMPARMSSASC